VVRRVILWLLLALLIVAGGLAFWARDHGKPWLDRTVRDRIAEVVDRATVEGYHFTITDLETDARKGDLVVTGAVLAFDSALVDSLREGRLDYLFAARAARLEMRGFSYWRLLLLHEFKAEALELVMPGFHYTIGGERVDLKAPFQRIKGGGGVRVSVLSVDTLLVREASCTVEDLSGRLPVLDLAGLDITTLAAHLAVSDRRDRIWVSMEDALFALDSLSTTLPDGSRLSTEGIRLSRSTRTGGIHRLKLVPSPLDMDTLAKDRMRRTVIDLSVEDITFSGVDVDALIAQQTLKLRHLHVDGARLAASLDKTLPEEPPQLRALPPAALLALRFTVHVDTLSVHKAEVLYRERDASTGRWGRLPLTALNARFLHVVNDAVEDPREEKLPLTGSFSGLLYDTALFNGGYAAELDGSQKFTLDLQVQELQCTTLNEATRPLMRLVMNEGQLHLLDLRMTGDERRAKGVVAMRLSDLHAQVEPGTPSGQRHSMFGSLLETMLAEEYGGGLDLDRSRTFQVERDPERGVFAYLWHVLREGLSRNLLPEAKERVRSMIRQDKARSREAKAKRKARREERR